MDFRGINMTRPTRSAVGVPGGSTFSTDMSKIMELNYNKYLPIITTTIKHWNNIYLTPLGKITIVKTFLISKLIHLFTSLPTPSDEFIKKVETQIYHL